MIEFPAEPAPNGVNVAPLDFGFIQRPASGAQALRVDRPGTRLRLEVTYPPMKPDTARRFTTRLQVARSEGLRIEMPLLDVRQGAAGSPVVDGADPTGTSLPVRGLTARYTAKEGFWLHIEDADGVRYLHRVTEPVTADDSGDATLSIWPAIRAPFADGSTIELAHPTFEGLLVEDSSWVLGIDRLVRFGGSIVIEEAA